jgi:hypothetical protein
LDRPEGGAAKYALLAIAVLAVSGPAVASDFAGQWEVTQISNERDGFRWSLEVSYPKRMALEMRGDQLAGRYTDQRGVACEFEVAALLNRGRDLLLAPCGETKSPEAYAPIHHVKLRDGKLVGVVTTNQRLFEWVAVRRE